MKFFLYFIFIFFFKSLSIQSLYYNYLTEFQNKKTSISTLVKKNFIEKLSLERNENFSIVEKDELTTLISYTSKNFGYSYNATYEIVKKTDDFYSILYKNNYIENTINLERVNDNTIQVNVELNSTYPIPKHFLNYIIKKKLRYLDDINE